VALCSVLIIMCSTSLSQSINVKSKHVLNFNKKSSFDTAPLPDAMNGQTIMDEQDTEEDGDDEYSFENEFGSSGSDIIGNPEGDLDKFQNSEAPYFLKEPENAFIIKKKPAIIKCKTIHALQVSQ
jgi:hypothetical protein